MLRILLVSFAVISAAAEPLRGPPQMKLATLAEEASFLARHYPRQLLPFADWSQDSSTWGRHLRNVGEMLCPLRFAFPSAECVHVGTQVMAPPGAMIETPAAPPGLGPTLLQV